MKKDNTEKIAMIYLKGILLGILASAVSLLCFAVVMLLAKLDRNFAVPFATLSVAVGGFFAAFFAAKRVGNKGYIVGMIIGTILFAVITLISLATNRSGLTMNTLFRFIIIILSSLCGGISGVNKGKNKKYI